MEQAAATGFTPMIAPALVKPEVMEGTGFLGAHASECIGWPTTTVPGRTSEVALAATTPTRSSTRCRAATPVFVVLPREAGRTARTPRHHPGALFDKVEMFSYCAPRCSGRAPALLAWEREFLDKLELPTA